MGALTALPGDRVAPERRVRWSARPPCWPHSSIFLRAAYPRRLPDMPGFGADTKPEAL